MKHVFLCLAIIGTIAPSLRAGVDLLHIPYTLPGRNSQQTRDIFNTRKLPFGDLQYIIPQTVSGEQYYRIPYTEAAERALDRLSLDEGLLETRSELPWVDTQDAREQSLKKRFEALRKGLDLEDTCKVKQHLWNLLGKVKKPEFKEYAEPILNKLREWKVSENKVIYALAEARARQYASVQEILMILEKALKKPASAYLINMALKFVKGTDGFPKNLGHAKEIITHILQNGTDQDKESIENALTNDELTMLKALLKNASNSSAKSDLEGFHARENEEACILHQEIIDEDFIGQGDGIKEILFLGIALPLEVGVRILSWLYSDSEGKKHLKKVGLVSKDMHKWSQYSLQLFRKEWIKSLVQLVMNEYTFDWLEDVEDDEYTNDWLEDAEDDEYTKQEKATVTFLENLPVKNRQVILNGDIIQQIEGWILRSDHWQDDSTFKLRLAIARLLLFETGRIRAFIKGSYQGTSKRLSLLAYCYKYASDEDFKTVLNEIRTKGIDSFFKQVTRYQTQGEYYENIELLYTNLVPSLMERKVSRSDLVSSSSKTWIRDNFIKNIFSSQLILAVLISRGIVWPCEIMDWEGFLYILISHLILQLENGTSPLILTKFVEDFWNGVTAKSNLLSSENLMLLKRRFLVALADELEGALVYTETALEKTMRDLFAKIYDMSLTWHPKEIAVKRFVWRLGLKRPRLREELGGPIL